jgi:Replication-relaxation
MRERLLEAGSLPRVRRPGAPTERTVRHILAVSETYIALTESAREHGFTLERFEVEPASWWPNGLGGFVKPDAYAVLATGRVRDRWWLELDLATESLPAIKRQLASYLDFWDRGQLGPGKITPRVVIATTTPERRRAIVRLVKQLPPAPADLFLIVQIHELTNALYRVLLE